MIFYPFKSEDERWKSYNRAILRDIPLFFGRYGVGEEDFS